MVTHRWGRRAAASGAISLALVLGACQPSQRAEFSPATDPVSGFRIDDHAQGPAPEIRGATKGGTVTIVGSADLGLEFGDPGGPAGPDVLVLYRQLLLRGLTGLIEAIAPDGTGRLRLVGDLATDTGRTTDGCRTWTYTLRDGVSFQDGTKITAEAVARGIHVSIINPFTTTLAERPTVQIPDDKTVVVAFPSPQCDFPLAAAQPSMTPLPPGRQNNVTGTDVVASGPYQVESVEHDRRTGVTKKLTLVRNPHWDPASDPLRHAYPDRWEIDVTAADRAEVAARLVEDSGPVQTALMWESLVGSGALTTVAGNAAAMARAVQGDTTYTIYLGINTRRVTDVNVRRSINYAYNKHDHIEIIGGKHAARPATTITGPTVPGYRQFDLYPAPATGDGDMARALLAGKTVPPLTYCYFSGSPTRDKAAAVAKNSLERAGLQIVLDPLGPSLFTVSRSPYANCDLFPLSWGQEYPWNSTVVGTLLRDRGPSLLEDPLPFADPGVTTELDRLAREPDLQVAAAGYQAVDERVMHDIIPVVPILHVRWFSLVGSKIAGAHISTTWGRVSLLDIHVLR